MIEITDIFPEKNHIYLQRDYPVLYSVEHLGSFFLVYKTIEEIGVEKYVYTQISPGVLKELEDSGRSFLSCFVESSFFITCVIKNNNTGAGDHSEGLPFTEILNYKPETVPEKILPPFGYSIKKENEKDNLLLWVDLETEGLNLNKHRILEYAFLLTDAHGNDLKEPLHGYINHGSFDCDPKAQELHGLTQEIVQEKGVRPEKFISLLEEFLEIRYPYPYDLAIAGQNVIDFDLKALKKLCSKYKKSYVVNGLGIRAMDLESLSLTFFPNRSVSLSNAALRMGHSQDVPHTALKDILLSRKLWLEYKNFMENGEFYG